MPPLLFMGEEWGSARPFPFFCDFHGRLADAVRKGRRAEFKCAYEQFGNNVPDPLAEKTFRSAVLDWDALAAPEAQGRLDLIRRLLRIRHTEIRQHLAAATFGASAIRESDAVLTANWKLGNSHHLELTANLGAEDAPQPDNAAPGRPIWGGTVPKTLAPWSVFWSIGAP
jgi:maltooligosyltrehalose trehalohydrolase